MVYHLSRVIECRNGLDPFGKIFNGDNDVLLVNDRGRETFHGVSSPFVEGSGYDDRVDRSGWCSSPCGKYLTTRIMFY